MLARFTTALLFKKSKQWLMPLFVVVFSIFLLFQQFSAFQSIRAESNAFCKNLEDVSLWIKGDYLSTSDLLKIKKIPDVLAASFIYKGSVGLNSSGGVKKSCTLLGIDETTHLGMPSKALYGSLRLKGEGDLAVVSGECAESLFKSRNQKLKPGSSIYLDHALVKVGGVVPAKRGLVVYTNYTKAKEILSNGETLIAIKAEPGVNLSLLKTKIERLSGLKAFTTNEFSKELFQVYMKENKAVSQFSVVIIFGLILALGIFITVFYQFFKTQLSNYSILKALGATPVFLSSLLTLQAAIISILGWSTSFLLYISLQRIFRGSELFFPLSGEILVISFCSLLGVSLSVGLFISFKVKEAL
jgi:putative ABC transport system permease protein